MQIVNFTAKNRTKKRILVTKDIDYLQFIILIIKLKTKCNNDLPGLILTQLWWVNRHSQSILNIL